MQRLRRRVVPWAVGLLATGSSLYLAFFVPWIAENLLGPSLAAMSESRSLWDVMVAFGVGTPDGVSWVLAAMVAAPLVVGWLPVAARTIGGPGSWSATAADVATAGTLAVLVTIGIFSIGRYFFAPLAAAVLLVLLDILAPNGEPAPSD